MSVNQVPSYEPENSQIIPLTGQNHIASVCEVSMGLAIKIFLPNTEQEFNVIAHAEAVSSLNLADRVIILLVDNGAIILHRLRREGERPQSGFTEKEDGTLSIKSKRSIVIETDQASFKIYSDGRIQLDGNEIYSVSKGMQYILGSQLNLN